MKQTTASAIVVGLSALGLFGATTSLVTVASAGKGMGPGHMRIVSVAGAGPVKTERTNFDVSGGKLASSVGCNRIAGPITIKGESMKIGPLAVTRRACVPKLAEVEQTYLAALPRVSAYKPRGTGIDLVDASGNVLVSLERAAGAPR